MRLLCVLVVFSFLPQAAFAQAILSNTQVSAAVNKAIKTIPTPVKIDKMTTLETVQLFGIRGIEYNYKLEINRTKITDAEFQATKVGLFNTMKNNLCTNPGMAWYKANFVELSYVYKDNTNTNFFKLRITPNDC